MNENNPLKIIKSEQRDPNQTLKNSSRQDRKLEAQAKCEREWLLKGNRCTRNDALERQKLDRTFILVKDCEDVTGKTVVDIGCGVGAFSRMLRDAGARVSAIDISSNALKLFEKHGKEQIEVIQDSLPNTKFKDDEFDIVVCCDTIASIHPDDRRLAMAEMSRIVKKEGWVICSTSIDINSVDALERFESLFQTEFTIKKSYESYNAYSIRFFNVLDAPRRFFEGWRSREYRNKMLQERMGVYHSWYQINSSPAIGWIWAVPSFVMSPIANLLRRSSWLVSLFEKLCHGISNQAGISHSILAGQRKPLIEGVTKKFEGSTSPFIRERKWE
jgi:2-polyprenyl-3-methyl-5-hydroxy-6-metoxy-1,4-benzoquinol methylase